LVQEDLKEPRDQLVPKVLQESLAHLEQWDFMEKEVHLVFPDRRVTAVQVDAEEIQDLLDKRENVVHKEHRVQSVWLDFQLRKEKGEMLDLVERQVH